MTVAQERPVDGSGRRGMGQAAGAGMPAFRPGRKSRWPMIAGVVIGLAVVAVAARYYVTAQGSEISSIVTYPVRMDSFDVRIPLNGEMKASRNVEIRNQVEGQTTILYLVPEGSHVNEGDLLVSLASDAIKEKLEDSRIRLENAMAATVNSEELVHIQEMQNESDIKAGETLAALARLEYDQFDKGDSKVQFDTFTTALANAKTDLERRAKDRERVQELAARQFVSENDVLDAVIAERDSKNKLDTAKMGLDVWNLYAEPRQRQTLTRKMDEASADLARIRAKANANLLLKRADLRAKQSTQRVEETRTKTLQDQLAACTIKAPKGGMVVYQSSIGGFQNQGGQIEEGATVRMNQTLIQLPDTSKMQVEVRLAEQLSDKVRKGQEVLVTVDAARGKVFHGKVDSIAVLPDSSNRWANPNLKEYPTEILLDEMDPSLKPGMSAKAEIMIERLSNVVAVPLQAIFSSGGQSYVFVGNADNYTKRDVVAGLSSSTKVEIKDGLKVGETVLLSRPKDAPPDQSDAQQKEKPAGKSATGNKSEPARSGA